MLILASTSSRRIELISKLGIPFKTVHVNVLEVSKFTFPEAIVTDIALKKSLAVQELGEDDIIISADTLVWFHGKVLGKPANFEDAFKTLKALSGHWHEVYTGVCLRTLEWTETFYEVTRVKFRKLSDEEIRYYISSGEPLDKAGSYGIQGLGAVLVEKIDGEYTNVVGLPLPKLWERLMDRGVLQRYVFGKRST